MDNDTFMNKLRSFLGLHVDPPRNDFRNPIWGSDDDDDGDELYSRDQMDAAVDIHTELSRHIHDMFRTFGGVFGDVKTFFHDDFNSFFNNDPFDGDHSGYGSGHSDQPDTNNIRDYYLKPGYNHRQLDEPRDVDLDGKISSISGLLKKQQESQTIGTVMPFDGTLVPGNSFCKTIITTSVKKPDGSIETRRIVKSGNEVIEETTTSSGPDNRNPQNPGLNPISTTGILLSELASMFKNFY